MCGEKSRGQPPESLTAVSEPAAASAAPRCPRCTGSSIRKPIGCAPVLCAAAVFVLVLLAEPVVLALRSVGWITEDLSFFYVRVGLAIALGLSILAIIVTACIAILGKYHCLSCGYRFRSICEMKPERLYPPFPVKFCLLNAVLLFLVCVSSREMLRLLLHGAFSIVAIEIAIAAIGAFFLIFISLGYQALIYSLLKTRIRNTLLWAILFLVPATALSANSLYRSLPRVMASKILTYGRLARLPESATNLRTDSWSSPFSGEWFLKFRASPEDIESFLNRSPSLEAQDSVKYTPERMRLSWPKERIQEASPQDGHEYFIPGSLTPEWYNPQIRQRGRRYNIPAEGFHNWGEVIVDDEEHVVFVKVVWS